MNRPTHILVPIRYPITGQTAQTLSHAAEVARDSDRAHILVLHVNIIQNNDNAHRLDIRRAVSPILGDTPFSVITRRGFFLEETILEEATSMAADIIVVGSNQAPRWRRLFARLLATDPAIIPYLKENTNSDVTVQVAQ